MATKIRLSFCQSEVQNHILFLCKRNKYNSFATNGPPLLTMHCKTILSQRFILFAFDLCFSFPHTSWHVVQWIGQLYFDTHLRGLDCLDIQEKLGLDWIDRMELNPAVWWTGDCAHKALFCTIKTELCLDRSQKNQVTHPVFSRI